MSKRKVLTVTTLGLGLSLLAVGLLTSATSVQAQPGCSSQGATYDRGRDDCGGRSSNCLIVTCPAY